MNFRRRPLSNEFKLLVECCRWGFTGGDREAVHRLLRTVEWHRVVALSQRHRVQGLAWHCLRNFEVPETHRITLSNDAAAVAEHNLRSAQLCASLQRAFREAGIALLFLKGLTLSRLAYGDPFLKTGWDVDILVPREAIAESAVVLDRLGFRSIVPSAEAGSDRLPGWHRRRKESVWVSADGLYVELHSRLADNPELIASIGIGSPKQEVTIAPGLTLPTLGRDDLFAYLCVHGASSAWFRLKWISDFAALFHGCTTEEIDRLFRHAEAVSAGRAAAQALVLAERVFGVPVPVRPTGRVANWLAGVAWDQMTRDPEPTSTPLGTLPIHYTQLFLRTGLPFKVKESARQLGDWTGKPR